MKRKETPTKQIETEKKPKELTDEEAQQQFQTELDEVEAKTEKVFVLLGHAKRTPDRTLLETLRGIDRILVHKSFPDVAERIDKEIRLALGADDSEEEGGLIMTNTATSYTFFQIWEDEMNAINQITDGPDKVVQFLALTINFLNYDYWYRDTDDPDAVDEIVAQMDQLWGQIFTWGPEKSGLSEDDVKCIKKILKKQIESKMNDAEYDVEFECLDDVEVSEGSEGEEFGDGEEGEGDGDDD
jgi:hypothetical protein